MHAREIERTASCFGISIEAENSDLIIRVLIMFMVMVVNTQVLEVRCGRWLWVRLVDFECCCRRRNLVCAAVKDGHILLV